MKSLPVLLLFTASFSFAQPYYRGEVAFATASTFSTVPAQTGLTLAGHLEAGYNVKSSDFAPVDLSLVLDPSVRVSQIVTTEPGLTELYAATTYGNFDLSAGIERLPLETARLSVPYGVETAGFRGVRRGVPGVRGVFYGGDWRVRGAVFYREITGQDFLENVTPLVSLRRTFDRFDLEAHTLYQNGLVAGLGGSGLVADVVVYGEVWLLTNPLEGRGALGLNGNLTNGTWTLEAAYLTPGGVNLKDDGDTIPAQLSPVINPRPAVRGQVALPLGDSDMSLSLTGNAFFDPDAVRSSLGASYTRLADGELTLGVAARFGPEPTVATLNLRVAGFF